MASGKPAGSATADANGQFVIIPEALKPGSHDLSLSQSTPGGSKPSSQNVAVSVPPRGGTEVIAALAEPGKPTQILSGGTPARQTGLALSFRSVEAGQGGGFYATGRAAPGAKLRIYLNDTHVADVTADTAGQWSLRVARGMTAGQYAVRADQVDPATANVLARAEVPFSYVPQAIAANPPAAGGVPAGTRTVSAPPVTVSISPPENSGGSLAAGLSPEKKAAAPAPAPGLPDKQASDPANVTIERVATANVVRGDSLWRISRKMLGQGVRYTQIYDANTSQIRDPRRIYPGQVLVVPAAGGNKAAR